MLDFKELDVWKESKKLAILVYKITDQFPKTEVFGLTNQSRRSAVSIPSNIAEGTGRKTDKETLHFLYIAKGSLFELETQIHIAKDLGFLTEHDFQNTLIPQLLKCRQILSGYIKYFDK